MISNDFPENQFFFFNKLCFVDIWFTVERNQTRIMIICMVFIKIVKVSYNTYFHSIEVKKSQYFLILIYILKVILKYIGKVVSMNKIPFMNL